MKRIAPNPLDPSERVSTPRVISSRDTEHRTGRERADWLDDQMTNALHQPYSAFHRFWFWAKKRLGR